jgi:hypothetical protein
MQNTVVNEVAVKWSFTRLLLLHKYSNNNNNNNNNFHFSFNSLFIYVPTWQPKGQLPSRHEKIDDDDDDDDVVRLEETYVRI